MTAGAHDRAELMVELFEDLGHQIQYERDERGTTS
jgi:hypothetical protein